MDKRENNQNFVDFRDDTAKAVDVLRNGGVIIYPTDTVWSLGCDATNSVAVDKLLKIKNSGTKDRLIALIDNSVKLQSYMEEVPDMAWDLIELSEKPLTIIYPDAKNLAGNFVAEDKSVGIRVTHEAFSKALCSRFRNPIVFTPANVSGTPTPETFSMISPDIKSAVDYIVTFRQQEHTGPDNSSIIKLGRGNIFEIIKQ